MTVTETLLLYLHTKWHGIMIVAVVVVVTGRKAGIAISYSMGGGNLGIFARQGVTCCTHYRSFWHGGGQFQLWTFCRYCAIMCKKIYATHSPNTQAHTQLVYFTHKNLSLC